jgi:hypothetical protein
MSSSVSHGQVRCTVFYRHTGEEVLLSDSDDIKAVAAQFHAQLGHTRCDLIAPEQYDAQHARGGTVTSPLSGPLYCYIVMRPFQSVTKREQRAIWALAAAVFCAIVAIVAWKYWSVSQ